MSGTKRQTFEIASLAEDTHAVLIGRGWECVGMWRWGDGRRRSAPRRLSVAEPRRRVYIDLSRSVPAEIPRHDWPDHFAPIAPIDIETLEPLEIARRYVDVRATPSPAHAALTDEQGGTADRDWPFVYAAAGAIGRAEAEHRVLRALKTQRVPGIVKSHASGFRSNWPIAQMVREWGDAPTGLDVRPFQPTRRDLDDWWRALTWFAALGPKAAGAPPTVDQQVIAWRAADPAYSWRQIGDRCQKSNEWARKTYQKSIDAVWAFANEGVAL